MHGLNTIYSDKLIYNVDGEVEATRVSRGVRLRFFVPHEASVFLVVKIYICIHLHLAVVHIERTW